MIKHRILTACLLTGTTLGGISLLMAAQTTKDDSKTPAKSPGLTVPTAPADSTRGIICFGNVDVDGKLLPLFPRDFPQPSYISELLVKEEQKVKEGDVLLKFDTMMAEHDVAKAKGAVVAAEKAVASYKVKLAEAEEGKNVTQPNLIERQTSVAKAILQKHEAGTLRLAELIRLTNLNGGSGAEVQAVKSEVEGLRQAYEAERLGVEALKATNMLDLKIDEAKAAVGQAEAQVEIQKQTLKQAEDALKRYGTLLSPCDGMIVRLECAKGMTVGAQTKVPLMIIQPKMPMIVRAEVEQEYTSKLKVGQIATLTDESDSKVNAKGKVIRIAPAFLPKRSAGGLPFEQMNEQRVLECIIEIEGDSSGLRLGQKMKVKLID